jgi:Holliday junction resolvasome RuvABC endonuclease subunit
MKTIVGLDMSYLHCVAAMVQYSRPTATSSEIKLIKTDLVETEPCKAKNIDRVRDEIAQAQRFIIEIRAFIKDADEVVIEMPLGSQDAISARYLGYCYAAVAAIELTASADFIYVTPFDLKLWSGKKKNTKAHVKDMVIRRLGRLVTTNDDNIIDALGICLMRCDQLSHEAIKQNSNTPPKQEGISSRDYPTRDVQQTLKFLSGD